MSLATWKAEFYPVDAVSVEAKDATAHSLQKWIGLRGENLERHQVVMYGDTVLANDEFHPVVIDAASCALCHHHITTDDRDLSSCPTCPLNIVRGGFPCDKATKAELCEVPSGPPYAQFIDSADPEPMIRWLTAARDLQKLKESA